MKSMIKGELFRLTKCKVYIILFAVLAVIMVFIVWDYDNSFYYQTAYNGYGISRYEIEDLPDIIAEYTEEIAECEAELADPQLIAAQREYLEETLDGLKTQLNVYNYLYKHGIAYSDYQDFAGMYNYYGDNAISAFATFGGELTAVLPVVFSFLAIWLMAWDYFRGTYKFLYSTQTPRKKIAAGRYVCWLIVTSAGVLLCCVAALCLGYMFGSGGGTVIFANASGAFGLNTFGVFCLEFADILFRTVVIGSVSFGLSLLFRNVILPAIPPLIMLTGSLFTFVIGEEVSPFLSVLMGGLPYTFIAECTRALYILYVVLIGLVFAAVCLLCGGFRFIKRDLK